MELDSHEEVRRTNISIFACCTAPTVMLLMNCYIRNQFCLNQEVRCFCGSRREQEEGGGAGPSG